VNQLFKLEDAEMLIKPSMELDGTTNYVD